MDILLNGEIDGIEVAQQIREIYNIPVIYLTGSENDTIRERANITDPSVFITKPFNDTEIHEAIETAMSTTSEIV
jgi:CheY-like chemotaxis protein